MTASPDAAVSLPVRSNRTSQVALIIALGVIGSTGAAVGVTKAGPIRSVSLPEGPLGLWRAAEGGTAAGAASVLTVLSIFALVIAFIALYRLASRGEVDARTAGLAGVAWSAPLLLAQPLLSLDAFSYAAQGQMVVAGLDPYAGGPVLLGGGPQLDAVAPVWRATPAPYGPLALAILAWIAALTGAELVPFVLLLRILAIVAVVACAIIAARLARPGRAALAVTLVAANPVVVLHLVGGAHLDALLGVLAGAVVLGVRRRWWWLAAPAAALALAVKLPGLVLVGYVLIARARTGPGRVAGVAKVTAVVALVMVACAGLVPEGWGWLSAMDTPGKVRLYYAVPTLVGGLLYGLSRLVGAEVPFPDVLGGARLLCAAAGAIAIGELVLRAGRSQSWRRAGALVGGALIVLAMAAPVVHAWYVTWGLVLIAACAGAVAQRWTVVLSVAACFTALPEQLTGAPGGLGLVFGLLIVAVGVAVSWPVAEARGAPEPALDAVPASPRNAGRD